MYRQRLASVTLSPSAFATHDRCSAASDSIVLPDGRQVPVSPRPPSAAPPPPALLSTTVSSLQAGRSSQAGRPSQVEHAMQLGEDSLRESMLQGRALSESILHSRGEPAIALGTIAPASLRRWPNEGAEATISPLAKPDEQSFVTQTTATASEESLEPNLESQRHRSTITTVLAAVQNEPFTPASTQESTPTQSAHAPAPAACNLLGPDNYLQTLSIFQRFAETKPWRTAKHGRSVVIDADWIPPQGWKSQDSLPISQPQQEAELTPIQRQQRWLSNS